MNEFTSSLKEVQSNILDDDEDEDLPQPSPNDTYQRQRDEVSECIQPLLIHITISIDTQ